MSAFFCECVLYSHVFGFADRCDPDKKASRAYESEENYGYLERNGQEGHIKTSDYEQRQIKVSKTFERQRRESLTNIMSEERILLRTNRSIQVEGEFGVLHTFACMRPFFPRFRFFFQICMKKRLPHKRFLACAVAPQYRYKT